MHYMHYYYDNQNRHMPKDYAINNQKVNTLVHPEG